VDGKKCIQQKNSTNKLSNHHKLTITRLRRVVRESHDEEADVKSFQRRLAGLKDFRSNIHTSKTRNNCRSERLATIVDFFYDGCGKRTEVESWRGADLQGLCASSV